MHKERGFALLEGLARLFMVNVTDDAAIEAMRGVEAASDEAARARRWFMHSVLRDVTPAWRVEAREIEESKVVEEPIPDLDPRVAVAIVAAMQGKDLQERARAVIYPVYGRILATAKLLG